MSAQKNIVENASKSDDHKTLVAAVKAVGLVETLQGKKDPLLSSLQPIKRSKHFQKGLSKAYCNLTKSPRLSKILTYHVVSGKMDFSDAIAKAIQDGKEKAMFKTVQGETLTAMMRGDK